MPQDKITIIQGVILKEKNILWTIVEDNRNLNLKLFFKYILKKI